MSLGKFLTVDPGEDTGWSVWQDESLLDCGTTKLWDFSDAVWAVAISAAFERATWLPDDLQEIANSVAGINTIVCEDWQLYPWVVRTGALDFDQCRTARLIGSLTAAARLAGWNFELQPAKIKERAEAAGAEALFSHPLKENRHANDAIRHGVWYVSYHDKSMPELQRAPSGNAT